MQFIHNVQVFTVPGNPRGHKAPAHKELTSLGGARQVTQQPYSILMCALIIRTSTDFFWVLMTLSHLILVTVQCRRFLLSSVYRHRELKALAKNTQQGSGRARIQS